MTADVISMGGCFYCLCVVTCETWGGEGEGAQIHYHHITKGGLTSGVSYQLIFERNFNILACIISDILFSFVLCTLLASDDLHVPLSAFNLAVSLNIACLGGRHSVIFL